MEKRQSIISPETRLTGVPSVPFLELRAMKEMKKVKTCFFGLESNVSPEFPHQDEQGWTESNTSPTTGPVML